MINGVSITAVILIVALIIDPEAVITDTWNLVRIWFLPAVMIGTVILLWAFNAH